MMRVLIPSLLALALLAGCEGIPGQRSVLPATAALEAVHDTYRREFAHLVITRAPAAGDDVARELEDNTHRAAALPPPFAGTLQAIRDFRTRYARAEPPPEKELAHLTVLEGMVYLQSNQFGSAASIADEVQRAGAVLTAQDDRPVRDQLFAESFPHLIGAWRQIDRELSGSGADVDRDEIERSTRALEAILGREPVRSTTDPYVDGGGIYLATSTAIFLTWLHELRGRDCALQRPACDDEVRRDWEGEVYYRRACSVMIPFLSTSEREAASIGARDSTEVQGRLVYLRWYAWLKSREACPAGTG